VIDLTQTTTTQKRVIRPPAARDRLIINKDATAVQIFLMSSRKLSKHTTSFGHIEHGYIIDLDYYGDNINLLDSACSYHMARQTTHLQQVV